MNFRSELSSRNKSICFILFFIFFEHCLCLGEQEAGNELSSAHEVKLVKSVINGALCWHLHRVIYGSLIEVKRRLVATAGEAAPDLCGCASEQPTGCSGEMKRQPSLSRCCFPSCLRWRGMRTIHFAGMAELGGAIHTSRHHLHEPLDLRGGGLTVTLQFAKTVATAHGRSHLLRWLFIAQVTFYLFVVAKWQNTAPCGLEMYFLFFIFCTGADVHAILARLPNLILACILGIKLVLEKVYKTVQQI